MKTKKISKKKISAYVLQMPFGDNAEGEVIHMDEEQAAALVEAGVLAEASEEDIGGGDEEEVMEAEDAPAETAAYARALERATTDIANRVGAKLSVTGSAPSVIPAQVKQPIFKGMGDMLQCQYKAYKRHDHAAMKRLQAYQNEVRQKVTLGANETTAGQGGYDVKPEWANDIWKRQRAYPDLLGMTQTVNVHTNTYNIVLMPEASLADGVRHAGTLAYWVNEGAAATSSYPAVDQVTTVLGTQVALVYATDQLLQDSNIEGFEQYIKEAVSLEFAWQHNESVVSGAGTTGLPCGILNQPALVTVAKESAQTAATVNFQNIAKMYRSLWAGCRANATWLVNPEIWHTLVSMTFPTASGTVSAFGGLTFNAGDEFPLRIFGRPCIEVLNLPQLGNVGDIILCDLSQMVTPQYPGLEAAVSTEIQFTTLQTAFRFVRRYTIVSPWKTATASVDGNYSYSPFIVLQSRGT